MICDVSNMTIGEVRAICDDVCVAHTEEGFFAFARYCPHYGADLSLGYVEGCSIRCCWHNLPVNLRTGLSPCRSITPLRVFALREIGPQLFETVTEIAGQT